MHVKRMNGNLFRILAINGCENLRLNYEVVDQLNVFPVPDGDTGTNMKMTIEGGIQEIINVQDKNIFEVSKKLARGMLMGARGNSGVILSQLFRGLSKGFEGCVSVDAIGLAKAFDKGVKEAYKAVMKPVEGTILTVVREGTEKMLAISSSRMSINEFFKEFILGLRESLQNTPELLPQLKEAGVVDSGGAGLIYIIDGMSKALEGEVLTSFNVDYTGGNEKQKFAGEAQGDVEFGYCTEFILKLSDENNNTEFNEKIIYELIEPLGNSIVFVRDEDVVKVHIHTLKPGDVLNIGQQFGEFLKLKIENMTVQHNETHDIEEEKIEPQPVIVKKPEERKKYAVVAVASGEGLVELFKELGTDYIVSGGQTMNPSTEDFIKGFDTLNAENIIVFPNNKNIVLAAKQAAKIYDECNVCVIESKSIAAGYAALGMLDLSCELDEIEEDMNKVISRVTSCQVTYAVRDTEIDGVKIKKDDFIGICNGKIVTCRHHRTNTLKDLMKSSDASDKDSLAIIYGVDAPKREVTEFQKFVEKTFPNLDVEVIEGKQDVYSYILVLE